jgi:hypothetical protein
MDDKRCAYCGSSGPLTREHLWPTSLHARLKEINGNEPNSFWLRRIGKDVEGEPTVKDVCAGCNNGVLSELDGYACELFDRYFVREMDRHDTISFAYDYHRLKRWLLKLCYNSARIHAGDDVFVFPPLIPYIRGGSPGTGRSVQLYLQLSYPSLQKDDEGKDMLFRPADHRVGHMWFNVPGLGRKLLRAVLLRAFSFYLAFYEPAGSSAIAKAFETAFLNCMPHAVLLRPSLPSVSLICDGQDAWASFEAARENSLKFS